MHISSSHDTFIRAILADKSIALDYFRASLPDAIWGKLDFSTLTQLPDSYVSKKLRKTISDIVYSCKLKDSEEEVKISLLIEHKSYVDPYMPIQVGSYIFSGLLKQISNSEKPSLIIPILLYHGSARWEYHTLGTLFGELEAEFKQFVPEYEYIYHNLGAISDDQIQVLENKFLAASFLALKYSQLREQLKGLIPTILTFAREQGENLQNSIIVYPFVNSGLEEDEIVTIIKELPVDIRDTVMNTLDIFVEKGRNQEREKLVRNFIKVSSLTDAQIAAAAEVDIAYVARLRKEIKFMK